MGVAFAASALALVVLLAVPVAVTFHFQGMEPLNGQIAIRWLFGLVRFRIHLPGTSRPAQTETAPDAAKWQMKSRRPGARANLGAVLRQAAFRRRVYRLAKDLVAALHVHRLRLRMRVGLGDPADTGRLWAFVGSLNAAANNPHYAHVQIEPEFMEPALEFEAHGQLLLVPLRFLFLAAGFAISPSSVRAWRTLKGGHA